MSFLGHVENGTGVFDPPLPLPNGTSIAAVAVPKRDDPGTNLQQSLTPTEWVEWWRTFCASQPRSEAIADDSRESIY